MYLTRYSLPQQYFHCNLFLPFFLKTVSQNLPNKNTAENISLVTEGIRLCEGQRYFFHSDAGWIKKIITGNTFVTSYVNHTWEKKSQKLNNLKRGFHKYTSGLHEKYKWNGNKCRRKNVGLALNTEGKKHTQLLILYIPNQHSQKFEVLGLNF